MFTQAATGESSLEPGMTFGSYTLVRRIGSGGMAAVFEAVHADLGKRVALKALLPQMALDPDVRMRFLREGQAAAKIRHQHVVDIYDVGTQGDVVFLVMEYLEGRDLGRMLAEESPMTISQIADIMLPVFASIHAAHSEGILHRDLKPANIFLAEDRNGDLVPKVLDFGISKILSDAATTALTGAGTLLGTPNYMSPEQASGDVGVDARSDQYALGVILYECAVGRRPFDGAASFQLLSRIVQGTFAPPRSINPSIPEEFERIILRAMARNADDRFESVHELGAAVIEFAGDRSRALWGPEFLATQRIPLDRKRSAASYASRPFVDAPSSPVSPPRGMIGLEGEDTFGVDEESTGAVLATSRPTLLLLAALSFAVAAAGTLGYFLFRRSDPQIVSVPAVLPAVVTKVVPEVAPPPPQPTSYRVSIQVEPPAAELEIDGEIVGRGSFDRSFEQDGRTHTLRVSHPGYEAQSVVFRDAPPPSSIQLKPVPEPPKPARAEPPPVVRSTSRSRSSGSQRSVAPPPSVPTPPPRSIAPVETPKTTERGANRAPILN